VGPVLMIQISYGENPQVAWTWACVCVCLCKCVCICVVRSIIILHLKFFYKGLWILLST